MMRLVLFTFLVVGTSRVAAQAASPPRAGSAAPSVAAEIAAAVLPLPEEFRADATVLGYRNGRLEPIRPGSGAMICLADNPDEARFHVACYQKGLEPFMARGRALRASGMSREASDSLRNAEVADGRLPMPARAALWQLSAAPDSMDWSTNTPRGGRALYVIYIPGATVESTGISGSPAPNTPWLMFPGTPRAHIMFVPTM